MDRIDNFQILTFTSLETGARKISLGQWLGLPKLIAFPVECASLERYWPYRLLPSD